MATKSHDDFRITRQMRALQTVGVMAVAVMMPWPGSTWAGPSPEPAIPAHLSLAEAMRIFRAQGLDLLIAEAQVQSAAGEAKAAAAIFNPSLGVAYDRSFFKAGLYETASGWSIGVGDANAIADALSGKRRLRIAVSQAALAAARLQRVDAQRTLELAVKQQYLRAALADASLTFARQVADSNTQTLALVRVRYASGAVSEVDVARTETAKLEADGIVDRAVATLGEAKIGLAFLLGRRGRSGDFAVDPGQLHFAVPAALASATIEGLVQRAFENRPDLGAQAHQRERASTAVALARRSRFPDVAAGLQYQQEGSGQTSPGTPAAITPPTLGLSISTTLPVFHQQQGEIQKAEADLAIQDAQFEKVRAVILSDVEAAFGAYQASRLLVERAEGRLLERAARSRELVTIQYQRGAASLIEYLDAQRTFIAVNAEYLQDLTDYWSAVFQLESATATEMTP